MTTCRRLNARSCFVSVTGAIRSVDNFLGVFALRSGGQRAEEQLGVAPHRHQQIIEVVRDAPREPADCFELLRLTQFVVALLRMLGTNGAGSSSSR